MDFWFDDRNFVIASKKGVLKRMIIPKETNKKSGDVGRRIMNMPKNRITKITKKYFPAKALKVVKHKKKEQMRRILEPDMRRELGLLRFVVCILFIFGFSCKL